MTQMPAARIPRSVASPSSEERATPVLSPLKSGEDDSYRHTSPKPLPRHSLPTLPENSWIQDSSRSTSVSSKGYNSPRRHSYQAGTKRASLPLAVQTEQGTPQSRPVPVLSPTRLDKVPTWSRSPSPTGSKFLTAVAAQERRVLELKEELQKAEKELTNLKKQFAIHEAMRKRNDPRRPQQMQTMETALSPETSDDDRSTSSRLLHKEMERRKTLLNGVRPHQRTVFSGSRHTRTLSLLSPDRNNTSFNFPKPNDRGVAEEPSKRSEATRSPTSPGLSDEAYDSGDSGRFVRDAINKDAIVRTGKQMASDFKQGLWTFLDDLRQATVGDEGINATQGRGRQISEAQRRAMREYRSSNSKNGSPVRSSPRKQSRQEGTTDKSNSRILLSGPEKAQPSTKTLSLSTINGYAYSTPDPQPPQSRTENTGQGVLNPEVTEAATSSAQDESAPPSSTNTAFSSENMSPAVTESSARTSVR